MYWSFIVAFENYKCLRTFKEAHALYAFILEAREPLIAAFGPEWEYRLEAVPDGEDTLLRATILLPETYKGDPEAALSAFDESWWLKNCHRSDARLVFDYALESSHD